MKQAAIRKRFSSLSIALHWVMVVLLSAVYATILLRENYPKGTDILEDLKTWHFMLGLTALVLVVIRLIARLCWKPGKIYLVASTDMLGRLRTVRCKIRISGRISAP